MHGFPFFYVTKCLRDITHGPILFHHPCNLFVAVLDRLSITFLHYPIHMSPSLRIDFGVVTGQGIPKLLAFNQAIVEASIREDLRLIRNVLDAWRTVFYFVVSFPERAFVSMHLQFHSSCMCHFSRTSSAGLFLGGSLTLLVECKTI